jgi:hypothetical protein
MLNDKQMSEVAYELDSFLVDLSEKYKLEPLNLSAVVLARLIRLTEEFGEGNHFHMIMETAMMSRTESSMH